MLCVLEALSFCDQHGTSSRSGKAVSFRLQVPDRKKADPVCRHMTQLESVVRRLMFLTQCNAGAKVRAWMNCQLGQ